MPDVLLAPVRFPDADVLQTGDTFWNGHYPFIDTANGGSIGGTLRATEENLKLVGERTQIIPGHGPATTMRAERQTNPFLLQLGL